MQTNRFDTAILLFSRTAAREAVSKSLISNTFPAKRSLAKALISHAKTVAKHSGFPVFVITELQQQGETFGDRLGNAFAQLFEKGFERVISIGNDCPTLQSSDLTWAAEQLSQTGLVLGPATDGGVYLIGMQYSSFKALDFQKIHWLTREVFRDLVTAAQRNFVCLAEKSDLDAPADLSRELRSRAFPTLLKISILKLLDAQSTTTPGSRNTPAPAVFLTSTKLRGPPIPAESLGPIR